MFQRFEEWVDNGIGRQRLGAIILGVLIVFLLALPWVPTISNYVKSILISGFFYAILASSWSLLAGVAGQFSFEIGRAHV